MLVILSACPLNVLRRVPVAYCAESEIKLVAFIPYFAKECFYSEFSIPAVVSLDLKGDNRQKIMLTTGTKYWFCFFLFVCLFVLGFVFVVFFCSLLFFVVVFFCFCSCFCFVFVFFFGVFFVVFFVFFFFVFCFFLGGGPFFFFSYSPTKK